MTCIVAVTDGARIVVGGDSAGVSGQSLVVRKDKKVFRKIDEVGNEWVFGFTTSFRMGQLIQYELALPTMDEKDQLDLHGFMVTKFITNLRKCLKDGGWSELKSGQECAGTFIVGLRGRLFVVLSDYQVEEPGDSFIAVGCGHDLAKGSLFTSQGIKNPIKRAELALLAAERFSGGVRAPFIFIESNI
jgi:ATP-dependent protease HslVU (ClpYQ) peptidase subunit